MLDTVRIVDTPEGIALRLPAAGPMPRALATRPTWKKAASGVMCGSSPLPEAVTRFIGTA